MTARIIVVDDDPVLTDTLVAVLESEGYEAQGYTQPQEALQALHQSRPDLLILDILMPRIDGLTLTSLIRRESDLAIILLSAKSEPSDRTIGLRLGADDYIAKPFDVEELVARVHIVLRRAAAKTPVEIGKPSTHDPAAYSGPAGERDEEFIRCGNLVVDFRNQDIWIKDRRVSLTPGEFRLLACLARNAGRTISRETLWQGIARGTKAMSRTLDMHVWRLREKMLAAAPDSPVIETIRGVGYRLRPAADKGVEASNLYGRGK